MALHEQSVGATDEWYTPRYIFRVLGCEFDLDVASPKTPIDWIPAKKFLHEKSLQTPWEGFIWMNPPFGARNGLAPWLDKFIQHGNGIGLVPDRTSAPWWQSAMPKMDLILFVSPKIKFVNIWGLSGRSPAQGTCLFSKGKLGTEALKRASSLGTLMVPL